MVRKDRCYSLDRAMELPVIGPYVTRFRLRSSRSPRSLIRHKRSDLDAPWGNEVARANMKRLIEFDVLRGVLLLMMIVDHSPSSLRRFTDQPLGFFTTAECFVFISALLAGMLFRKRMEKTGFAVARSSTIRRAWRIYGAHIATLAFTFIPGSLFLSEFPPVANLLDHYLVNPWARIGSSLLLLFRPPLMDILPMYVLLSLLTPVVFRVARNWGWKIVLLASFAAVKHNYRTAFVTIAPGTYNSESRG
jgi:hypothetical protein